MTIGASMKSAVDGVRDMLGTSFTVTEDDGTVTDIGKCAVHSIDIETARVQVGLGYEDEIDSHWARIETSTDVEPLEGQLLTDGNTGEKWVVRKVIPAQAAGVTMAYRCVCSKKLDR